MVSNLGLAASWISLHRDFSDHECPLQGGRLDVIRGRTIAALVYRRRKHVVSVALPASARWKSSDWAKLRRLTIKAEALWKKCDLEPKRKIPFGSA
jgi:hypothetical protein